jgi:hypothetical protein
VLAAQLESLLGNRARALDLADTAIRLEPGNPTNILAAVTLRSQSPRVTERAAARELLWPIARTNGPFRLHAINVLLASKDTPRTERETILDLLTAVPQPTFEDRILSYEVRANLDPSQSRALAEDAIRTLRPASERELRLLVEWLVLHDFIPEALNQMAGQRVFRDRGLFILRHRILMLKGDHQKGYDFLFNPAAPLPPFELETLRCQAAAALGNARLRDEHLANAASLAGTDIRHAATVTQLAVFCQNLAPALDTWRGVLRNPRSAGVALRQLIQIAEAQGDTLAVRDFARQLAAAEPAHPTARLTVAHCNLLLDEHVDDSLSEVRTRLSSSPTDPHLTALVALGHLRRKEPAEAAGAIRGIVVRKNTPAATLAILAAVAAANDHAQEARILMDRIRLLDLRPEERELLRPILAEDSRLVSEPATP